jgi:hypothetical protein
LFGERSRLDSGLEFHIILLYVTAKNISGFDHRDLIIGGEIAFRNGRLAALPFFGVSCFSVFSGVVGV